VQLCWPLDLVANDLRSFSGYGRSPDIKQLQQEPGGRLRESTKVLTRHWWRTPTENNPHPSPWRITFFRLMTTATMA